MPELKILKNKPYLKISVIFLLVSTLWIVISDRITFSGIINLQPETVQTIKGLFYVMVTAVLIYFLVKRDIVRIRKSENKFKVLFDSNPNAMVLVRITDKKIINANRACLNLLGFEKSDVTGKYIDDLDIFTSDTDRQRIRNEQIENKRLTDFEIILKTVPGHFITAIFNSETIEINDELFSLTILQNISERKKTERQLHEKSEQLSSILESSPLPIMSISKTGVVLTYNPAAEKLFNWSAEEVIGKFNPIISEDTKEEFLKHLDSAVKGKSHQGIEIRRKSKTGKDLFLSLFTAPLRDQNNEIIGVTAVFEDIEERKKTEELLRNSENRYRSLFENNHAVMLIINPENGTIVDANPAACSYYKYDYESIIKMKVDDINILSPAEIFNEMRRAEEEGKYYFIFKHKLGNGEIRDVEVYSGPINIAGNHYLFSIIHDITGRKEIERKLIDSEFKYKTLANHTYDWEFWLGADGGYNFISPSCETMTGYSIDEFKENPELNLDIVHPKDYDVVKEHFENEYTDSEKVCTLEYRIKTKDGTVKWISHTCRPIIENNKFLGRRGTNRDITKEKNAQLALEENEKKLSVIIENADAIIFTLDTELTFTLCEGKALEDLDINSEKIIGQRFEELFKVGSIEEIESVFEGKMHHEVVEKQGGYYDLSLVPIYSIEGSVDKIVGIAIDITERIKSEILLKDHKEELEELVKQRTNKLESVNVELANQLEKQKEIEETIKRALEREKELSELKTRFLSTTSHEFRTPLTSIFSSAELLEMFGRKWDENKFKVHVGRIKSSVDYLIQLLDDILILSRAESGRLRLNLEKVNIHDLCEELVKEARLLSNEKHEILYDHKCENDTFLVDKKILRFIINNLLSNAVKYSPVNTSIKLITYENKGDIYFEVTDNGMGIPEDEIDHIFDSFFRANNVKDTRGNGLGLSIVKKSVELHNGEISVKSKINEGSTFTVQLPIKKN
ncbi:MAG: PAS domain S-box protein [Melioribacteraceae bacterium]|nr:PAS domain S-box protein [Melioribacteraceae bacterium]